MTSINVVIDVGPAVHQAAGLSRYTKRLVEHLAAVDQLELTLFYNRHSNRALPAPLEQFCSRTISLGQHPWRLGVYLSQLLRWHYFQRSIQAGRSTGNGQHQGIYHATEHLLPHLSCPTVMTVHDLIFERYPQHHTRRNRLFLRMAMPLFVRSADMIIAVSHHSKQDLMGLYATPTDKIAVIYEGIDASFKPSSAHEIVPVKERYSPDRPYLLMVGTLEPRKNHITAFRAMRRLRDLGYNHRLLVAGGKGWLFDSIAAQVAALGLNEDVSFTGFVPDEDLPALYSGADCVLVPSLYEGFGFAVLEAMACGTPVICSQRGSLGEIAGDAALILEEPEDDFALVALIERILGENDLVQSLSICGHARAANFTWKQTALGTTEVYASLAKVKR